VTGTREEQIKELLKTPELFGIRKLYRYRSFKSQELEGIFTRREIYLPKTTDFNDPFECRPRITLNMSGLQWELLLRQGARQNFPSADKRTRKKLIDQARMRLISDPDFFLKIYEDFLSITGLYCLSQINDDILMWSHYSDGHKGVCLEFDAIHDATFSNRILFGQAIKVIYRDERPVVNIINIGEPQEYQKTLLTKSKHWEYETEWRVIKTPGEGGCGIKPFHPSSLTGVILGALISQENKQKMLGWIKRYPSKLSLYQAKINETNYKIDIEPI
jgi:hypothetical protein